MGCARGSGQVVGGGCQGYAGPDTWQVHRTRHSGEESGSIWYIPFLVLSRFDEMTCNLQRDGLRRLSVYEGNDEGLRGDSRWRGRRGCTGILNEYRLPTCLIIPFPLTRHVKILPSTIAIILDFNLSINAPLRPFIQLVQFIPFFLQIRHYS